MSKHAIDRCACFYEPSRTQKNATINANAKTMKTAVFHKTDRLMSFI
jgi:hypothetical protein